MDDYDTAVQSIEDLANHRAGELNNILVGNIGGGKELYGTLEALEFAKMNNAYNSAEAVKQREFEERMSNTAYQRAAKDLEAIGFSPLALMGGANAASTPSGSAATSNNSPGNKSGAGNPILDLVKTIGLLVIGGAKIGAGNAIAGEKLNLARKSLGLKQALAVENNLTKLDYGRILKGLLK